MSTVINTPVHSSSLEEDEAVNRAEANDKHAHNTCTSEGADANEGCTKIEYVTNSDGPYEVYLASFKNHLSTVRAHLSGDMPNEAGALEEEDVGVWSLSEQNHFFRALAVHSRWRPDLISTCVQTKNVVEVCQYLEQLEAATQENEGRGNTKDRAQRDSALEVSEEWIDEEERLAADVVKREEELTVTWRDYNREEEVKQKKKEIYRSKDRWKGRYCKNMKRRRTQTDEESGMESEPSPSKEDDEARREQIELWTAEKKMLWERQDILEQLEVVHMRVLDALLRQSEEGRADIASTSMQMDAEHLPQEVAEGNNTPAGDNSMIVDGMIDPLLLAISREATCAPDSGPLNDGTDTQTTNTNANTILSKQPQVIFDHAQDTYISMHPPNIIDPYIEADASPTELANLSPKSRRRYQKRLYMRRKRAQATGGEVVAEVGRLKPGRKVQPRKKPRQFLCGTGEEVGGEKGLEDEEVEDTRHPHVGGTTKPYRVKAKITKLDIDGAWLRENDLALFHLSNLSKLASLYRSLESGDEPPIIISASLIQSLHSLVKAFVAIVVHRVIVLREQEAKLKANTKAWRVTPDQVPATSIKNALEIVGAKYKDKKAHFSELLRMVQGDSEPEGGSAHSDERTENPSDESENGGEVVEDDGTYKGSLYRHIYAPLIRPASWLSLDAMQCLSRTYVRDMAGVRVLGSAPLSPTYDDELMPLEMDEDDLLVELKEEEELDRKDCASAKQYEQGLWVEIKP